MIGKVENINKKSLMKKSREQIEKYLSGKTEENENFPVSSFLISKRYKKHIKNLYLFARNADDIADNSFLEPSKKKKNSFTI